MTHVDNDAAVRDRAYILWELAGRPIGQEHEFWARASREIEGDQQGEAESQKPVTHHAKVGPEDESREDLQGAPSAAHEDKEELAAGKQAPE